MMSTEIDTKIRAIVSDTEYTVDDKVAQLQLLRQELEENEQKAVDRFFVDQLETCRTAIAELIDFKERAKEFIDELTADPYYPVMFAGFTQTARGKLLRVRSRNNEEFIVGYGEELDVGSLRLGDEVLLGNKRNVALYHGDNRRVSGELATVERVLADGRLVLECNGIEHLASAPPDSAASKGDTVRWDRRTGLIFEVLEQDQPESAAVRDQLTIDQLKGMDLVTVADRLSNSILKAEIARRYEVDGRHNKLLLLGPPGTGKTTFAQALAAHLEQQVGKQVLLKVIRGEELASPYVGVTSANLRNAFKQCNDYAASHGSYCVLFIDEVDVYRVRGLHGNHHHDRHTNTLLAEISNLHPNVIFIAATNQADALDSAMRERFAMEIEFPRPRRKTAAEIAGVHLGKELPYYEAEGRSAEQTRAEIINRMITRLYSPNADNAIALLKFRDGKSRLVKAGELVSGRLIAQIAARIRQNAFNRDALGGRQGIDVHDVEPAVQAAIERLRRTLTRQNVYNYLGDLPTDIDVIAVEPVTGTSAKSAYLQ